MKIPTFKSLITEKVIDNIYDYNNEILNKFIKNSNENKLLKIDYNIVKNIINKILKSKIFDYLENYINKNIELFIFENLNSDIDIIEINIKDMIDNISDDITNEIIENYYTDIVITQD